MRFVIIASPRTGSSHLVYKLGAHPEVFCNGNIFHPKRVWVLWPKQEFGRGLKAELLKLQKEDPKQLLERVFAASFGREHVGFKIFEDENDTILEKLIKDSSIKKIVLYRKNVLANYASYVAASHSKEFDVPEGQKKEEVLKVKFVWRDFVKFHDKYMLFYTKVFDKLHEARQQYHLMEYEEINNPILFASLLNFIGADPAAAVEAGNQVRRQVKQNPSDILARFSNHEDVRQILERRGWLHWLQEGETSLDLLSSKNRIDKPKPEPSKEMKPVRNWKDIVPDIQVIRFDDEADIAGMMKDYGLPHLDACLRDIESLMSGDDEGYGRRYQREALRRPGLTITSPLSGTSVTSAASYFVRGRVFYHFEEGDDEYFLGASRIKVGYPLTGLFIPRCNRLLTWDDQKHHIEVEHLRSLLKIASTSNARSGKVVPTIPMGHDNFAHHLWNELSALERLLDEGPTNPPPSIVVARETLGPIEAIFPELNDWNIARAHKRQRSRLGSDESAFYVNLGGFRISSALRSRIVGYAQAAAGAKANALIKEIADRQAPVFWVSVRTRRPTFVNQREVIAEVAGRIVENYKECSIILDGFSLPRDWQEAGEKFLRLYGTYSEESKAEIDAIMGEINIRHSPSRSQQLYNGGGMDVLDSIALAQIANVYLCHLGTMQHKIGWTANSRGIIHCNGTLLSTKPEVWHGTAIDGGVQPLAIDIDMVKDLAPGQRDGNYRAVDPLDLSYWVIERFSQLLSKSAVVPPAAEQRPEPLMTSA